MLDPESLADGALGTFDPGGGSGTGRVNPTPDVRVVSDSPTARVYDVSPATVCPASIRLSDADRCCQQGDGGMGHIVCAEAMEWAIGTAKQFGTAAATTRNHFHVGATGFYPRMAVREGCIAICMSSHRSMTPRSDDGELTSIADFVHQGDDITRSVLASPMSIGIPAGASQPPIVLDMAAGMGGSDDIRSVLKNLGLQAAVVTLGGVVAGIYQQQLLPGATEWEANQGCMLIVLDAEKFLPTQEYGDSMDHFVSEATKLPAIEGLDHAELPGGDQARRIAHCEAHGIELEPLHAQSLRELAAELGVPLPPSLAGAARL